MTEQENEQHVSRETLEEQPTGETSETTENEDETTESEEPAAELTTENEDDSDGNSAGDRDEQLADVRREAAGYRKKLREAETELQQVKAELFHSRVAATGKLADPTDMPVDTELLADDDELQAAIDSLLQDKPHLKARSFGNIGQGERPAPDPVSLGSILRNNA